MASGVQDEHKPHECKHGGDRLTTVTLYDNVNRLVTIAISRETFTTLFIKVWAMPVASCRYYLPIGSTLQRGAERGSLWLASLVINDLSRRSIYEK